MKTITNKKNLTLSDLVNVLESHRQDGDRRRKLKRYYMGQHDILKKQGRKNAAPNNRLVSNFPAYIVNMSAGFFIGQPISYKTSSDKEKELEALLDIFKYNDEAAHNLDLAEEAAITGDAYELLYIDSDANIRFTCVPSEEMILVCDASLEENILYAIRHFRIYDLDLSTFDEFVDVYDEKTISHYEYTNRCDLKLLSQENHYWDDVPVVEFPNNHQHKGDFEDVLTLVDAYNLAQSLTLDDMEDFTDAFLILKGMGGTNAEDIKQLRREKAIILDEGGDAQWLIKNINDAYIENVKTRIQKDIHKFANIPDMSDENFTGNMSGVAIKYKLIGLEQIRSRKEREFKKSLQRRIELIAGILELRQKARIDFRDVDIQFTANIPANVSEQAQIVNQLDGVVSQKTLLGLLPFVPDPMAEIDELHKEREGEIENFVNG